MAKESFEKARKLEKDQRDKYLTEVLPKHMALLSRHKIPHKIIVPGKHIRLKVSIKTRVYMVEYWPDVGAWLVPKTNAKGSGIPSMLRYFRMVPFTRSKG